MAALQYDDETQEYLGYIAAYDKEVANWHKRCKKILQRYKQEAKDASKQDNEGVRFNILWSNVQLLIPATFSVMPQPDVSRRFRDNDPVGRVAALLLERALEFELKHFDDFRATMKACVQDRFLPGRGTSWVRYEPHLVPQVQVTDDQAQNDGDQPEDPASLDADQPSGESEEGEPAEEIDFESSPVDYVAWSDFGHTVARTWEEVGCVWRIVYLSRDSLRERFGSEMADRIPLDASQTGNNTVKRLQPNEPKNRARVYEIWDKEKKCVVWLCKGVGQLLDKKDDPLGLENFWPCPKPLFATITNDSLVPTPDFALYQDQATELDTISDRIDGLIKALKIRGVYDAAIPELRRLFQETGNNDLVPVKNWAAFAEAKGLQGAVDLVDLEPIVQGLEAAYAARKEAVDQVYEITGISDLMRGTNDPAATATAERQKGQFGTLRMRETQRQVAQFAGEIIQIKAQVMCRLYQPEYLAKIGGAAQLLPEDQKYVQPAMAMLQDRVLRDFRVDIEADSLVQMDEAQEKQDRMEFLSAVGAFLEKTMQAATQTPAMGPILGELFKFGITGFRVGKTIEGALDNAIDLLRKNAGAPPPPNPAMVKAQAETQAHSQQQQVELQADQQRTQMELAADKQREQLKVWADQQRDAAEAHRNALQSAMEARLEQQRMAQERWQERTHQMLEFVLARLDRATRLEVAEIGKETTLAGAQISAANAAQQGGNDAAVPGQV
jgi:hypothetical protein